MVDRNLRYQVYRPEMQLNCNKNPIIAQSVFCFAETVL